MAELMMEEPGAATLIEREMQSGRIESARLLLVEATEASVYRFLRHLLHADDLVEDLFQETYLRAFAALEGFRGDSTPTTWVLSIARNLAFNKLRRLRTEAQWRVEAGELPEVAAAPAPPEPGMAHRALEAGLRALPTAQREAVLLFYMEDQPVEVIARLTGRPVNTIKSDLRRARSALRRTLDPDEAGP